jgi:hypothetical protein
MFTKYHIQAQQLMSRKSDLTEAYRRHERSVSKREEAAKKLKVKFQTGTPPTVRWTDEIT